MDILPFALIENIDLSFQVLQPEDLITGLGYYFLSSGASDKAYSAFSMNIKNYPDHYNVYDSMGDYYDNQKYKAKAIEYYLKALKIKDNPDTKKKLEKLTAGK